MTLFLDHNLPTRLAQILRLLDVDARALSEEFPVDVPDVDWIRKVGEWGWIVFTADLHIRTRGQEHAALHDSGLVVVFLHERVARRSLWNLTLWVLQQWPKMRPLLEEARPGTFFRAKTGPLERM